jgi:O-antigen/teichoic acid export membrane protein
VPAEAHTEAGGASPASSHRLMTLLGRALSRDAAYYTLGMASVFPLGIASALVTTAYLEPAEYGRLGLLMVFASLATIVYGLGVIQGTLMWAYGSAGDDGDADDGGEEELGPGDQQVTTIREHRRRVMGSGLLLATLVAVVGTAVLVANAGAIARQIGGHIPLHDAVVWAAVSAGLGSLWRLALQVYRLERRAAMFLVVSVSRPLFALVLTIVLLSSGHGLEGAVAAIALGTALSLVIAFGAALPHYLIRFRPADFAEIVRRGRSYALIIIVLWIVSNADLWILSRFSTGPDVGLYRLASRFGVFPSYVTSAYLLAWIPMQRSSLFRATARARTTGRLSATMFTYYCIGAGGLLLVLTVCSELFIGFAPESYRKAAPYVPAVAAAVTAHGALYVLYRIGRFKNRRLLYVSMLTLAAAVLAFGGSLLAGPLGGYGVALAGGIGSLLGAAGFVVAIRRGKKPIPFQWSRVGRAVAVASGLIVAVSLSPAEGIARVGQDLIVLAAYPVLLVVCGVIPRDVVGDVLTVGRAVIPLRPGRRRLAERVETLPADERAAITQWIGSKRSKEPSLDVDPRERASLFALTRGLRALSGDGDPTELDAEIGAYLTHRGSHIDRDLLAEKLVERGADAAELHLLDDTYETLRQGRRLLYQRHRRLERTNATNVTAS